MQPQRLGVYISQVKICRNPIYDMFDMFFQDVGWSDRPIYKHVDRSEYLFYLQSRSKGLWMIGPKVKIYLPLVCRYLNPRYTKQLKSMRPSCLLARYQAFWLTYVYKNTILAKKHDYWLESNCLLANSHSFVCRLYFNIHIVNIVKFLHLSYFCSQL